MAQRFILVPESSAEIVPRQMAEDLMAVTQVPTENLDSLGARVAEANGFVDRKRLLDLARSVVPDPKLAHALVRVIMFLSPQAVPEAVANIRKWREQSTQNAESFSASALQALEERLPRLIREFPALERYRKASRLKSTLGTTVQAVELICDLRPVFDKDRARIEGLVPITVLKLTCETQNEETTVIEVTLDRNMVDELQEEVKKAQTKLMVIHETAEEWLSGSVIEPE